MSISYLHSIQVMYCIVSCTIYTYYFAKDEQRLSKCRLVSFPFNSFRRIRLNWQNTAGTTTYVLKFEEIKLIPLLTFGMCSVNALIAVISNDILLQFFSVFFLFFYYFKIFHFSRKKANIRKVYCKCRNDFRIRPFLGWVGAILLLLLLHYFNIFC